MTPSALPVSSAGELSPDELKMYELIWKRTLASQMSDARGTTMTVRFGGVATDGRDAEFSATGTVITHRGFLAVYEEGKDADAEVRTFLRLGFQVFLLSGGFLVPVFILVVGFATPQQRA